jgi:hypothetical protein
VVQTDDRPRWSGCRRANQVIAAAVGVDLATLEGATVGVLVPMRAAAEQAGVAHGATLGLTASYGVGMRGAIEQGFVIGANAYRDAAQLGVPGFGPRGSPSTDAG